MSIKLTNIYTNIHKEEKSCHSKNLKIKSRGQWRRLDGVNREIVEVGVPCLLTVDALLDKPRYPSVHSIRAAQRRKIEQYDRASLGLSLEEVGSAGSKTHAIKLSVSKPRPKRLFTPDSSLPAAERIRLIMSGGMTEKKENRLEGNPAGLASELIQFLRQEKTLP